MLLCDAGEVGKEPQVLLRGPELDSDFRVALAGAGEVVRSTAWNDRAFPRPYDAFPSVDHDLDTAGLHHEVLVSPWMDVDERIPAA